MTKKRISIAQAIDAILDVPPTMSPTSDAVASIRFRCGVSERQAAKLFSQIIEADVVRQEDETVWMSAQGSNTLTMLRVPTMLTRWVRGDQT